MKKPTGDARALLVLRGHALVGLVLAMALGGGSFLFHAGTASRAVCSSGAMGCLFGAAVGLNISERIRRGRPPYLLAASIVLACVAASLVAVSAMALERNMEGAWSPFVGAGFVAVLAIIFWRLSR